MELRVEKDVLNGGLQAVAGVAPARPTAPILANALLEADGETLTLSATNLDLGVRCTIPAAVKVAGSVTLPVRKLAAIARALPSAAVDLVAQKGGGAVKISGGGSLFRLATLAVEDFPGLSEPDGPSQQLSLPAGELLGLLRLVDYAQSADEDRHILHGIHFRFADDSLTIVATDGRRLAAISRPDSPGDGAVTIPARTVTTLKELLAGGTTASIAFSPRQFSFAIDYPESVAAPRSVYGVSKVVEGAYPNYRQVIPGATRYRVRLAREVLLDALQRVTLVSSGTAPSVQLKFSQDLLELSSSSPEYGEAHERLAVPFPAGEGLEIAFNPRYLVEPLRALSDEELFLELRDSLDPCVLRRTDSFLCVVMPLRTGSA
ncbi:MAG: DNA polymerase III subunit beta [Puniceicoccales bacterium]|jgi:DNA polymerase-3 subunit beta|nr:DNA polymerase III subunit beta [Puniceicoccales bacterium]